MHQTFSYPLEIAGVSMLLQSDRCLPEEREFVPFFSACEAPDYVIRFQRTDRLPPIPAQILHEDHCWRVHPAEAGKGLRSFFDAPRDLTPYAVAEYDHPNGVIRVEYLEKGARCVSELHNSFAHLDLEGILLQKQRLCLHAACVQTELGGILFSGPSGIGKSTQADLWCELRHAQPVNGDRPILSRDGTIWRAWGSPYAGSSRWHVNVSCPIRAIVMLRQAASCTLRRLGPAEAFRRIWSGLTVHSWDAAYVAAASGLAIELAAAVPVYELACTPDERAVTCLEAGLRSPD